MKPLKKDAKGKGAKGKKGLFNNLNPKTSGKRGRLAKDFRFDYKQPEVLIRYLSEQYKIQPRRTTGLSKIQQTDLICNIKRARILGLLPFTERHAQVGDA